MIYHISIIFKKECIHPLLYAALVRYSITSLTLNYSLIEKLKEKLNTLLALFTPALIGVTFGLVA